MSTLLKPRGIVLHLTASTYGDADQINDWHKAQKWSGIGYHKVVLNGVRRQGDKYNPALDGTVDPGRSEKIQGAHCRANSMNSCTLGISCIGTPNNMPTNAEKAPAQATSKPYLTKKQYQALITSLAQWCVKYQLNPSGTFVHPTTGVKHAVLTQHSKHDAKKPFCASLEMEFVRQEVAKAVSQMSEESIAALERADLETPIDHEMLLPEFSFPLGDEEGPVEPVSDLPPISQQAPLVQ